MEEVKPVINQLVHYEYGFSHYTGRVVEIYDDCYVVKGPYIGKVRVTFGHTFFKSITGDQMKLLFKNGQPVMKKKWFCPL